MFIYILYSVFYHSSAKGSVMFGTVPTDRLMLLYLKMEFVVVKRGDPVPSLWSWWLKLESGSEVVFKEERDAAEISLLLHGPCKYPWPFCLREPSSAGPGEQKHVWFLQGKLWACSVTLWGITHFALIVNGSVLLM